MVFYSHQADEDLEEIREGLLAWKKFELTREFVFQYVDDIKQVCEGLSNRRLHFNASYPQHARYGSKVYRYHRNARTTWYIIYDVDTHNNIYINKIISNYLTV